MVPFAHLHVHSEYSLLDGACRIEQLVERVSDLGQTSCALTDHGVMYGAIDFIGPARPRASIRSSAARSTSRRIRATSAATSTANGTVTSFCCART